MDEVIKDIDGQIVAAEELFHEELSMSYEEESSKNDETHRNVQKLETKVNNLAQSVHNLFVEFDQLS